MMWLSTALASYFFAAVAALLDKVLVSRRIKKPALYAFFVSLFSLFILVFAPFGLQYYDVRTMGILFLSGIFGLFGLFFFYSALKESEVSRVAPVVGVLSTILAILVSIGSDFTDAASAHPVSLEQFLALLLLVGGGILLAFDFPLRPGERISLTVIPAAFFLTASLFLMKEGFVANANFISVLVWSRIGMFLGGLSLLLIPVFRSDILDGCASLRGYSRRKVETGTLFVINKICGGLAAFLLAYAVSVGHVTFVQSLMGTQYLFLFFLAWMLSIQYRGVFEERFRFSDWAQKFVGVAFIVLGIWFAVFGGTHLFL